jgi:triosephosphate isomerase
VNNCRRPMLIGNWKLNHTRASAEVFFDELLPRLNEHRAIEIAIAPVAPMLDLVGRLIKNSPVVLAAQNVYSQTQGAFTGEWSALNLKELDVRYCIVGHSERRQIFHETDQLVSAKAEALLKVGITPVCCIGETKAEREAECTYDVLARQILAIVEHVDKACEMVFAYEPIWAIGTGRNASPEVVQETHSFIRENLAGLLGQAQANKTRVLYGGSVSPHNIKEIVNMPDVDGALVGGASLQVESFLSMVKELSDLTKA